MQPLELPNVTLCAIDSITPLLAAQALSRSVAACRFGRVLLLTDAEVDTPFERIGIRHLDSREAYSAFMLRELNAFIHTPHVLIVQWDGFVTDPSCWDPAFLEYDYIGARWRFHDDGHDVGNGGFSLRSKRLLEALTDPQFDARVETEPAEDGLICRTWRRRLEADHGIRFAPPALADRFSYEGTPPSRPTFGFHGGGCLDRHLPAQDADAIAWALPPLSLACLRMQLTCMEKRRVDMFGKLFARTWASADPQTVHRQWLRLLTRPELVRQVIDLGMLFVPGSGKAGAPSPQVPTATRDSAAANSPSAVPSDSTESGR